ncbi:MAG TPA: T9SS type A sorting domain-containing protein [Melioribacteraceae bacterium]|nr:T9SS type A sorting domain-containing protein [Melioribacteraceae bacterium]
MKKLLLLVFTLLVTFSLTTYAQKTSAASGNWNDPATWTGGVVPTAADDVVVAAGHTVTINVTNAECKDVTIDGNLDFQKDGTVSGITILGNVKVNPNGRFRCNSRSPAGNADTYVEHLMTLHGDLTVEATGTVDFRAGSNSGGTSNGVLLTFAGSTDSNIRLQNTIYRSSTSSGNYYGEEFNSIVINKTGTGKVVLKSGNLYMSNNSSVGGTMMTFTNGIIETEGESIWGYLSTSGSNLTGESNNSYTKGWLGRGLSNGGGNVRRTFGVGDNGGIRKVVVGSQAPGNATGHLLVVKCITGNANNSSAFQGGIDKVSGVRYYAITYTRSGVTGAAGSITIDTLGIGYAADDGVAAGNINLRVAYSTDNRATWKAVPQTTPHATTLGAEQSIVGGDIITPAIPLAEGQTIYIALARVTGTTENTLTGGADVQKQDEIPTSFSLSQNYPNPFNPTTNINFSIPVSGNVTLDVYNALGQKVESLVNGYLETGSYKVSFDAANYSSGIYFYQIKSNGFSQTRKMLLVK